MPKCFVFNDWKKPIFAMLGIKKTKATKYCTNAITLASIAETEVSLGISVLTQANKKPAVIIAIAPLTGWWFDIGIHNKKIKWELA